VTAKDVTRTESDPVARFDMIASVVADADITVRTAPDTLPTHTDGRTIWVSEQDGRDGLRRAREAVLVQALLLRHGTLDRRVLRRLRRPAVARRYLGFEVRRALSLGSPVPLVARLADTLDDLGPVSKSAEESLARARRRMPCGPTPRHWGTIIPKSVRRVVHRGSDHLMSAHTEQATAIDRRPSGANGEDRVGAAPEKERPEFFTLMARRIRGRGKRRRSANSSGPMLDGWSSGTSAATSAKGSIPPLPVPTTSESSSDCATWYPEWDVSRAAYRADWCVVREHPVPQRHDALIPQIQADPDLRRAMARLARSLTAEKGRLEGDDIDLDALIDRHASIRANRSWNRGVYIAHVRTKPDLVVMILMDASSSTAQPLDSGRSVFQEEHTTASALIDAMSAVGLTTAWWTFRSQGRHAVQVEQVKAFHDRADYNMHARAAKILPSGFTRLGTAVRHAAKAIDAQAGVGHRLLIVLSDGIAFDHGYEGAHADSDIRMALLEARSRGIGCLCLSMGVTSDDPRLQDTFGTREYLRYSSWRDLRGDTAPLLRATIRASQ
jgi:nitric oxide reductase NorD protein